MKDPLSKEESPYEILGVSNDSSLKGINDAFGGYLAKRKNPQKGMKARSSLTNMKERIEIDMFFYQFGEITVEPQDSDLKIHVPDYCPVPVFQAGQIFTDLDLEDHSGDITEVSFEDKPFTVARDLDRSPEYHIGEEFEG